MIARVDHLKKMTRMCLASILFHSEWLSSVLNVDHCFFACSYSHRNNTIQVQRNNVIISYPWNDRNNNAFSGIPPHAAMIQQLTMVQECQQLLVVDFVEKMTEVLHQMGVDGGRMNEVTLRNILNEFREEFRAQLAPAPELAELAAVEAVNQPEVQRRYNAHWFDGSGHRVPADWRFPRCGVFDVFRQWWIGDTVRHIVPLQQLKKTDMEYLDSLPLAPDEMHGRTGKFADQRRPAGKIYSDLKFLMEFLHDRVWERGLFPNEITPLSVDEMYLGVCDVLTDVERDTQKHWTSAVVSVRLRYPGYRRLRIQRHGFRRGG
jgi:hypothetical protein